MSRQVDWPGLMRLGLGTMRLSPDVFWSMTPCEFLAALEGAGVLLEGAPDRAMLDRLMQAFPDG